MVQRNVAQALPGDRIADKEALGITGPAQPNDRRQNLAGVQGRRFRGEPLNQRVARTLGIPARVIVGPLAKPNP
jgi:hypothetical protein